MKSVSIQDIRCGAAVELIDAEIAKVVANINDPNTEASVKRTVTLKIDFKPDATRDAVIIDMAASAKLASDRAVRAYAYIQQDGGEPYLVDQLDIEDTARKSELIALPRSEKDEVSNG